MELEEYPWSIKPLKFQGFGVICDGDSGGPMVVRRKTGSYALLGVASFGTDEDCSKVGEAAVYTSVYYYLPWISHFVDLTFIWRILYDEIVKRRVLKTVVWNRKPYLYMTSMAKFCRTKSDLWCGGVLNFSGIPSFTIFLSLCFIIIKNAT